MRKQCSWIAQWLVVLATAYLLKSYYSTASADHLRWILAPTATLVEIVCGVTFEYEAHAGYLSREHRFLIAPSCAGVNFLITAFLMLNVRRLLAQRWEKIAWSCIPTAALVAYLVTLIANTTRISVALKMPWISEQISWLNAEQLHRFEGIILYFGFLLLLFIVSEKVSSVKRSGLWRQPWLPLIVYYSTALGIPLANGAYRQGYAFWEYALFVLLIPLVLILPLAAWKNHCQK